MIVASLDLGRALGILALQAFSHCALVHGCSPQVAIVAPQPMVHQHLPRASGPLAANTGVAAQDATARASAKGARRRSSMIMVPRAVDDDAVTGMLAAWLPLSVVHHFISAADNSIVTGASGATTRIGQLSCSGLHENASHDRNVAGPAENPCGT